MRKGKRSKAIDGEFPLPEVIIQHIQSFLEARRAARTSVLSKAWYNAWLTRPNLDFDSMDFGMPYGAGYLYFVKRTVQRCEESNLKIKSLKLRVRICDSESSALINELLLKVIKMGVEDIDIHLYPFPLIHFVLPHEVLETDTLVRLSLSGLLNYEGPPRLKVICAGVKSLNLRCVGDYLASCSFPCLEELSLEYCFGFKALNCRGIKSLILKEMSVKDDLDPCVFPCLEYLTLERCYDFKALNCPRLKLLSLREMRVGDYLLYNVYPCLEDLTIESCYGFEVLHISSPLLKLISLARLGKLRAKLDVPNICKFKLSGSCHPSTFPSLSITTVSRDWESDISLNIHGLCLSDLWCRQLRRFIGKLSASKVSLSIDFVDDIDYMFDEELKRKPGPMVENLTLLNPTPSCRSSDLLNGLLWSCRPKLITQYWFPSSHIKNEVIASNEFIKEKEKEKADNEFIKFLCKWLIRVRKDHGIDDQVLFSNHDLGDVRAQYFDVCLAKWRDVPLKTLLSASKCAKAKQSIRFQLEWCGK